MVVLGATWLSEWSYLVLILAVQAVCLVELSRMLNPDNKYALSVITLSQVLALLASAVFALQKINGLSAVSPISKTPLLVLCSLIICCILPVFILMFRNESFIDAIKVHAIGLLIISFPCYFLLIIRDMEPQLIVSILAIIWTHDTFAYLTGKMIGKTKLAPSISPGKTWEGTSGGVFFGIAAAIGLSFWLNMPITKAIGLGLVCTIFANLGDLLESKIKRESGVKDSGSFMPGHGGMYDRFDALLGAAIPISIYLMYF